MPERRVTRSLVETAAGRPCFVLVLSEDLCGARQWAQALSQQDLNFVCEHPNRLGSTPGAWATIDLIVLLGPERGAGILPRPLGHARRSWIVVLGRPATGAERAWWIENGADDCVSQPCEQQELVARLRAALRRRQSSAGGAGSLSVGPLTLWPRERAVTLHGRRLALTTCEFSLLVVLAEHAGEVLGRETLLEFAKGSAEQSFERAIDVQISRLRAKLGDDPRQPHLLKTVRGLGYVLVAEPAPPAA